MQTSANIGRRYIEAGCTNTAPVYADSHIVPFQTLQPTIKKHIH